MPPQFDECVAVLDELLIAAELLEAAWARAEAAQPCGKAAPQSCGHPVSAIVSTDEGTHYCAECAKAGAT